MGKRNKSSSRNELVSGTIVLQISRGSPYQPVAICRLSPSFAFTAATGLTINTFGGAKLLTLSDVFQYFRFRKLRARLLGSYSSNPTLQVLGYFPDSPVGTPLSLDETLSAPWTSEVVFSNNSSVVSFCQPSVTAWKAIPPKMLLKQNINWWRTRVDSSVDEQFEYQGTLVFAWGGFTALFDTAHVVLEYECEFKDFVGPGQTPMRPVAPIDPPTDPDEKDPNRSWPDRGREVQLTREDAISLDKAIADGFVKVLLEPASSSKVAPPVVTKRV